ncbi:MAG: ThuA domain-containing protein [Melioribacteraceae bacterium]|nr:ThuA domain-containing protein [Melioribacteraceae bacterium]
MKYLCFESWRPLDTKFINVGLGTRLRKQQITIMKYSKASIFILFYCSLGFGQHLYQQPKSPKNISEIENIIGNLNNKEVSRTRHIVWVYGYDKDHIAGAHDYVRVKDTMISLLQEVPNIIIEGAFEFPNAAQLDQADLLVMYLHMSKLKQKQFDALKAFVSKGGGIISLHETAIMRPASKGRQLAECLGYAWNEGYSKWGAIFDSISVNNHHPIFKGFDQKIFIPDEFYWDLFHQEGTEILGSVRTGPEGDSSGPIPKNELSDKTSPVFWTYGISKGKVFGTTTGHHTFTYFDPEFRIILFRAIAWALGEEPDPFMSLVYKGITHAGKVGIQEDLRDWQDKIRE